MKKQNHILSADTLTPKEWVQSNKWIVLLVGVASLVVMLWSFTLGSSSKNPFLPYYEAFQPTRLEDNFSPWEQEILTLYKEGNYEQAMLMLEQYCRDPKVEYDYRLMLGSAYLEDGQIELAVEQFKRVSSAFAMGVRRDGLWYLAVAYTKDNQHAEADKILGILLKNPGKYKDDAVELRSLLDV